jgi:hypothetical protein
VQTVMCFIHPRVTLTFTSELTRALRVSSAQSIARSFPDVLQQMTPLRAIEARVCSPRAPRPPASATRSLTGSQIAKTAWARAVAVFPKRLDLSVVPQIAETAMMGAKALKSCRASVSSRPEEWLAEYSRGFVRCV